MLELLEVNEACSICIESYFKYNKINFTCMCQAMEPRMYGRRIVAAVSNIVSKVADNYQMMECNNIQMSIGYQSCIDLNLAASLHARRTGAFLPQIPFG